MDGRNAGRDGGRGRPAGGRGGRGRGGRWKPRDHLSAVSEIPAQGSEGTSHDDADPPAQHTQNGGQISRKGQKKAKPRKTKPQFAVSTEAVDCHTQTPSAFVPESKLAEIKNTVFKAQNYLREMNEKYLQACNALDDVLSGIDSIECDDLNGVASEIGNLEQTQTRTTAMNHDGDKESGRDQSVEVSEPRTLNAVEDFQRKSPSAESMALNFGQEEINSRQHVIEDARKAELVRLENDRIEAARVEEEGRSLREKEEQKRKAEIEQQMAEDAERKRRANERRKQLAEEEKAEAKKARELMRKQEELKRRQAAEELVEAKKKEAEERQAHLDAIKSQNVPQQQPASGSPRTVAIDMGSAGSTSEVGSTPSGNPLKGEEEVLSVSPAKESSITLTPTKRAVTVSIGSGMDSSGTSTSAKSTSAKTTSAKIDDVKSTPNPAKPNKRARPRHVVGQSVNAGTSEEASTPSGDHQTGKEEVMSASQAEKSSIALTSETKPAKRAVTVSMGSGMDSSAKSVAVLNSTPNPAKPRRARPRHVVKSVAFDRTKISNFVYPYDRTRPPDEHGVFALIENEGSRKKGQDVILLYSKASALKVELTTLRYQREGGRAKADKELLKEQDTWLELLEKRDHIVDVNSKRKKENEKQLAQQQKKTLDQKKEIVTEYKKMTKDLKDEIHKSECALKDAPQRIRDNDKLVKEIEDEISSLQTKVDEKDSQANAIREEMDLLKISKAEEREAKLASIDKQITDTRSQITEKRRQLEQMKGAKSSDQGEIESVEDEIRDMDATIDRLKDQKKTVKKGWEQQKEQQKGLWSKLTSSIWGEAESQPKSLQEVLDEKLTKCRVEWNKLRDEVDQKEKALTEEKNFPSNWPSKKTRIERTLPGLQDRLKSLDKKKLQEVKKIEDKYDTWKVSFEERSERSYAITNDAIESFVKQIKDKEAQIKDMETALSMDAKSFDKLVARKRAEVDDVLRKLSDLQGEKADLRSFNIDKLHDRRGLTLLSVAALNEDVKTVRVCLEVGASPSVLNADNTTAIEISHRFGFDEITALLGTSHIQASNWRCLEEVAPIDADLAKDWEDTLEVANAAAVPAEALRESPEACEADEEKRMPFLESDSTTDFSCFENRLVEGAFNSSTTRRIVLLNKDVYNWCLTVDATARSSFVDILEGLKPAAIRRPHVPATRIRRRSIVGTIITFELLAAPFQAENSEEMVALLTPFVSGSVDGYNSIGILVWAIVKDEEASLYRTLISNVEFLRNKVALEDDFPAHLPGVLELGVDMHLLDLASTSIWNTRVLELLILNVDDGGLDNLQTKGFKFKRRKVYSDLLIYRKIFDNNDAEDEAQVRVLNKGKTLNVIGGAGTGKTLLLIEKTAAENPSKRILVVTRLPRLINMIKTKVEEKRKEGLENLKYCTYEQLMQQLSRLVAPQDERDCRSFGQFEHVQYDSGEDLSFLRDFVQDHLNDKERKNLKKNSVEPLSLWGSIITIKSHSSVVETKAPLSEDAYLRLAPSFGLRKEQRALCYSLFVIYEKWRKKHKAWDQMDRTLYILKHGPASFSEYPFVSWKDRLDKHGDTTVKDFPFFFHKVAADESQDFTESDMAVFARMSRGKRSLYFSADAAQSVEPGVKLRRTTFHEVMYTMITDGSQVKDVVDTILLKINYRTHKAILAVANAFRKILARSFQVANPSEEALINGDLPEMLSVRSLNELAPDNCFRGSNVVFVAPDELVGHLRSRFNDNGLSNDVFGVREAKGLEFDSVALVGFFTTFENSGCGEQWQNCLRWLSSDKKTTVTTSNEKIGGKFLADCDYTLSCPELSDQCMLLYTAITRARNKLYFVEADELQKNAKGTVSLTGFAYRRLGELKLAKDVTKIDTGKIEITPAEHKARGVANVVQAVVLSREGKPLSAVTAKLNEAIAKFAPDKANDSELYEKTKKHLSCVKEKARLVRYVKEELKKDGGGYDLRNKFGKVMEFEKLTGEFMARYLGDSFLVEEVERVVRLVEEVLSGSPYEIRMNDYMAKIRMISTP